ncbi:MULTISPECIES: hypothetical protein [Mycobacterium]|uniref:hypothetical protein n=1 Tax=Mycobacterium TaxID=1763 RepID=UPI001CDA29ED|nr:MULTISPECIES: hypothetical protein [Mycobacterium]MCA2245153.1 hypothetical protein [Mycobacterium sp. WUMAC-067]MCA2316644.1 hypothetical protein [Mycobacterium sp. WUMAC-025]MEE3751905.1 hypothetical protein [Mycobacterium intracellulare]
MKTLLEFIVQYVGVLYLNPKYRITNSSNRGLADIDASISFTGEQLRWDLVNDRGLIYFAAVPLLQTVSDDWFGLALIRQYLEGGDDTGADAPIDQANWLSTNLTRVEELFADQSTAERVCEELLTLRRSNSSKKWGWPKPDEIN